MLFSMMILLAGCRKTPLPEYSLSIQIDSSHLLQTIQTVSGGNFIHNTGLVYETMDPIGRYNLENLNMLHARVRITLEDWEPVNDNEDPGNVNLAGFKDVGFNHNTFLFMQELQSKGITIIASIWNVPDWMVANPLK
jgi:hypothetical protein